MKKIRFFSYVVEHDTGEAPNPYFGFCTLCLCKYRKSPKEKRRNIVELANEGDWVIGTGGANPRRSAGNGKLVYAMRVDRKITLERYHANHAYAHKKPSPYGSFAQQRGDNMPPKNSFERNERFVLISWHFYYFGDNAKSIPVTKRRDVEKRGVGFRYLSEECAGWFERWVKRFRRGKHGEPWMKQSLQRKRAQACKSSC
jgi:fructose-specific component phosphotransferase system IIB-like protein